MFKYMRGHELLGYFAIPKKTHFLRRIQSGELIPLEAFHGGSDEDHDYGQPYGMRRIFPSPELEKLRNYLSLTCPTRVTLQEKKRLEGVIGRAKVSKDLSSPPLRTPEEIEADYRSARIWTDLRPCTLEEKEELEVILDPASVWRDLRFNARQEENLWDRLLSAWYQISEEEALLLAAQDISKDPHEDAGPDESPNPVICFYEKQNRWFIGPLGGELSFETTARGFKCLHVLLENPNQVFKAKDFDNLNRAPLDSPLEAAAYSGMTKDQLAQEGLRTGHSSFHEVTKRDKDGAHELALPITEIEEAIKNLQEELNELNMIIPDLLTTDQETRIGVLERTIPIAKSQLSECRPGTKTSRAEVKKEKAPESEGARVRVYNHINHALDKIHGSLPTMEPFLNKRTISTGKTLMYRPDLDNQPIWKLYPEDGGEFSSSS
jgi:hypothetical protein